MPVTVCGDSDDEEDAAEGGAEGGASPSGRNGPHGFSPRHGAAGKHCPNRTGALYTCAWVPSPCVPLADKSEHAQGMVSTYSLL